MTATVKGAANLRDFLAALPPNIERTVLRGALKAGADVIAEGAREGCRSAEVRASIQTTSGSEKGLVTAKVQTKGDGAYKAPWLEYGTDPHFISVDREASGGRTAKRVNKLVGDGLLEPAGTLIIGGVPVGKTVHHPGADPYPFMRPALDLHEAAAIAAIGSHIGAKLNRATLEGPVTPDDDE